MSSNAAAVSPDTAQNPEPHKPQSLYQKKRHTSDIVLRIVIYTATAITVAALIGIIGYILWNGIPHITWSFLSSPYSETRASMKGILPMIINTLYIVVITLLISAPIGISAAIYLTQYAKQGKLVRAIPSIIFGLFGYTVFCILFRLQTSIIAGCLTMAICVLPTIIRTTEEALLAVPGSYKEGALALGAGKFRVIMGIVLPCAMPGVLTAVILAMGRIVGESAALLFTSGLSYNMPSGFFSQIMSSGRTLTLHLYQTAREAASPDALNVAFATASVLLIFIFILNRLASLLSKVLKKG